jgi:predicted transcriptional regulator
LTVRLPKRRTAQKAGIQQGENWQEAGLEAQAENINT